MQKNIVIAFILKSTVSLLDLKIIINFDYDRKNKVAVCFNLKLASDVHPSIK